ncbi:MAG: hypothetical protein IKS69_08390 [Erysipelotrichaceae bacterium]|nr:hypothetical protein [Erysipelotrichaceae bacterium]
MKLYEYLMKELSLEEELAKKIAEKTKEYHHAYGHHRHDYHEESIPLTEMTVEKMTMEELLKANLQELHCNGCENHCPLSEPKCGRGKKLTEMIQS